MAPQKLIPLETPPKIYQDDFSPGRGNALQAAVASIFGLSLELVPNFVALPEGYEAAIKKFCEERGTHSVKFNLGNGMPSIREEEDDEFNSRLCLLRGKSPRGDFGHVVVARFVSGEFEMLHDPHPDATFLDAKDPFGWCMFFLQR
jgi:hypothetical protein